MARLNLTLLGGFRAWLDEDRAVAPPIKKAQALLAYLAVPLGQTHPRDRLAALLWGDMRAPQARAGLRQVLFALRKALGDADALRLEAETVALDPAAVGVDVHEFEQCVADGSPAALERAATLHAGDFLESLALGNSPFEEWLVSQRMRLRELALEALARLLAHQRDAGALEAAVRTALRLVSLDPLQEPVHRTLMRLYADSVGAERRSASSSSASPLPSTSCRPSPKPRRRRSTVTFSSEPRRDRPPPGLYAHRAARAPGASPAADQCHLFPEAPLVGREVELGQLQDARQAAWAGQGRMVAVIGQAGIRQAVSLPELIDAAGREGGRALVGHCHESEQVLPFGPWLDALRAGRIAEEEELLSSLGAVWRGSSGGSFQRSPMGPQARPPPMPPSSSRPSPGFWSGWRSRNPFC